MQAEPLRIDLAAAVSIQKALCVGRAELGIQVATQTAQQVGDIGVGIGEAGPSDVHEPGRVGGCEEHVGRDRSPWESRSCPLPSDANATSNSVRASAATRPRTSFITIEIELSKGAFSTGVEWSLRAASASWSMTALRC